MIIVSKKLVRAQEDGGGREKTIRIELAKFTKLTKLSSKVL